MTEPKTAAEYLDRGCDKDDQKDSKGAIEDYNKAIELNPNYAEAYANRGVAKIKLGDNYGAISDYSKAIEINPRFAMAYYNRGNTKRKLGDNYGAISDYSKAIEINPRFAMVYYNRGGTKDLTGDRQGAIADWQKAADLGHESATKIIKQIKQESNNSPVSSEIGDSEDPNPIWLIMLTAIVMGIGLSLSKDGGNYKKNYKRSSIEYSMPSHRHITPNNLRHL